MKKALLFSIFLLFLTSCNHDVRKLCDYIEKNTMYDLGVDTCYIDLQRALGIEYDKMYVAHSYDNKYGIGQLMKMPYYNNHDVQWDCNRWIFIKGNKVVYEFNYNRKRVNFYLPFVDHQDQPIKTSIFKVVKSESDDGKPYYGLIPSYSETN